MWVQQKVLYVWVHFKNQFVLKTVKLDSSSVLLYCVTEASHTVGLIFLLHTVCSFSVHTGESAFYILTSVFSLSNKIMNAKTVSLSSVSMYFFLSDYVASTKKKWTNKVIIMMMRMKILSVTLENVSSVFLTGSKEARIFWEVWEDSQSGDQQQHIIRWFTGEAIVHSRIRR